MPNAFIFFAYLKKNVYLHFVHSVRVRFKYFNINYVREMRIYKISSIRENNIPRQS